MPTLSSNVYYIIIAVCAVSLCLQLVSKASKALAFYFSAYPNTFSLNYVKNILKIDLKNEGNGHEMRYTVKKSRVRDRLKCIKGGESKFAQTFP